MHDLVCRCNVCGTEKAEEANGWYDVQAEEGQLRIQPWSGLLLHEYEHICGQECLHKRLSQWLEITTN